MHSRGALIQCRDFSGPAPMCDKSRRFFEMLTQCCIDGRSLMNVPFTISKGADLETKFLKEATKAGLVSAISGFQAFYLAFDCMP